MSTIENALAKKYEQSPQFDYMWRVELPVLSQVSDPTKTVKSYASKFLKNSSGYDSKIISPTGSEDISHRVYQINTPFTSFESRKSIHGTGFRYGAGNNDIGNITMTVDEFEDGATLKYFMTWMDMIKNEDGSVNPPAYYKRNIKYIYMSSANTDLHVSEYTRYFPIEISPLHSSYETNGVMQYSITLAGDDVRHSIIKDAKRASIENEILGAKYGIQSFDIFGNKITFRKNNV